MIPGTYVRTAWHKKKASKKMKQIWTSRRKSAAMKAWHENNAKNGGVHPVWKTPYKTIAKKNTTPLSTETVSLLELLKRAQITRDNAGNLVVHLAPSQNA